MHGKDYFQGVLDGQLENETISWTDRFTAVVALMNKRAEGGDTQFGQLRESLSAAPGGPEGDKYRDGVGHYVWSMAEFGDHKRALELACEKADVLSPPKSDVFTAREGWQNVRAMLSKSWKSLNTPRR